MKNSLNEKGLEEKEHQQKYIKLPGCALIADETSLYFSLANANLIYSHKERALQVMLIDKKQFDKT